MDWNRGYTAYYRAYTVDPETWRDMEEIDIISGSVEHTSDGLKESAKIETPEIDGSRENWIRAYMYAMQDDQPPVRVPVFTGLTGSPEKSIDGAITKYSVDCYSVLKPASDIILPRGWYAPAGISGAVIVRNLLDIIAPVDVSETSAPELTAAVIADDGETALTMAEKVLDAMSWTVRITGAGHIAIMPESTEIKASFDALNYDIVEAQVTQKNDWFECPNVYRATVGDTTATARDDSADSPLSTVSRGREVWKSENDVTLSTGESLTDYAIRALKAAQRPSNTLKYSRRFIPDVSVGDIVYIHYPDKDIDGRYKVTSQTINLEKGGKTDEGAEEVE